MTDLILFIVMMNLLASLIVFLAIMRDNNNHFIKWVKYSFEMRNWFGKLQICLFIIWMMPTIIIVTALSPIAFLLGSIISGVILGCMKIVELGKK